MIFPKNEYLESEVMLMITYIQNYVISKSDELDPIKGFQLGIVTCNLLTYFNIQGLDPSKLNQSEIDFLRNYDDILNQFPDLIPYLKDLYAKNLENYEKSNPLEYKVLMDKKKMLMSE